MIYLDTRTPGPKTLRTTDLLGYIQICPFFVVVQTISKFIMGDYHDQHSVAYCCLVPFDEQYKGVPATALYFKEITISNEQKRALIAAHFLPSIHERPSIT